MFDFIKRAQLTRQGLSCGKTRRKHVQGELKEALRFDPLVGAALFGLAFAGITFLLEALSTSLPVSTGVNGVYTAAIFLTAAMHWFLACPENDRCNTRILLSFIALVLQLAGTTAVLSLGHHRGWDTGFSLLLVPHALAPVILCMLAGRRIGLFGSVYVTLLGATLVENTNTLPFIAIGLSLGFLGVFVTHGVRRRSRLFTCGFYIGALATLHMVLFNQLTVSLGGQEALMLASPMLAGVLTVMIAGALLPALETLFQMTTPITWLEQGDLNHPLMRRLSIEAPGTYHHSLVVANLAEAAAESIGANASMCRVCSYFHDIGKLTKPEYFIENMNPEDNPHDDLTPRMSALVLIAHVKDGVDLAIKNRLNSKIIDVIEQHHGNSLVYFFYRRALDQKKEILRLVEEDKAREDDVPEVSEDGFRYPGPRPQFRESAIISLADAVESASRTLAKPTPSRVEQMVEDIVRNRLLDHQLDECDLTLAELASLKQSFVKTLLSMLHSRVRYPKEPEAKATPVEDARKQASELEPAKAPSTKSSHAA